MTKQGSTHPFGQGGNPKGFLIHVISALGYIERSKLYEKWVSAKTQVNKYVADLQDAQDAVTNLLARSKKLRKVQQESNEESDEPAKALPAQAKKGKTNSPTVPAEPSEKEKITEDLSQLRKRYNGHLEDWKKAQEKRREAGSANFRLYKILLDETALLKWNKIVQKQISVTP